MNTEKDWSKASDEELGNALKQWLQPDGAPTLERELVRRYLAQRERILDEHGQAMQLLTVIAERDEEIRRLRETWLNPQDLYQCSGCGGLHPQNRPVCGACKTIECYEAAMRETCKLVSTSVGPNLARAITAPIHAALEKKP